MNDSYQVSTPEQVALGFEIVGLGSRFLAALLDTLIQTVVLLALILLVGLVNTLLGPLGGARSGDWVAGATVALVVLLLFLTYWGYHIFFEMAWNGQTPGKRLIGIRVLTTGGQPITLVHSLIRNLVRIVDYLPASYMIGAVAILVTPRCQRLGDLAAGTIVVRERREAAPRTLEGYAGQALSPAQASLFKADDVTLAREFLLRRDTLPLERRQALAEQIASRFRARLGPSAAAVPAEALLASVAALRR
jgi:uncharacterized RDD family membrane protein YckC